MEVGEIGGKRPHKGKAKGKGKQKQKQQSKQQDKDYSDYQCHNCGKMRHISSQCWSKSRKGKGKGKDKTVSAVQASTSASSASDVGSVGAGSAPGSMIASLVNNPTIYETATCEHDEDAGWILAIEPSFRNAALEHLYETAIDTFHEVLVDSGAERCVCPPFLGARCATCNSVESMFGHSFRRTAGSFWLSSCEFGFCSESSPFESSFHDSECSTSDSLCGVAC